MKNNIPFSKLIGFLSESRFFHPVKFHKGVHTYIYVPTGKNIDIPIRENYSKDFLENLFTESTALDIPFHLVWLYIETL